MSKKTVPAPCKIGACEPFCGLLVDIEDGRMTGVHPDPDHEISKGYVCIKGMAIPEYQNAVDRLHYPLKREAEGWSRVSWPQATKEIGRKLRQLVDEHGPRSIATYWGNAADSIAITMANTFCHSFGSPNSFNVLSLEYTDRAPVAHELYGHEHLSLQPDVSNAKYAILLGTNPVETQGLTLLQRRPNVVKDIKAAKAAGGTLVVVDPRRTKTARLADVHLAIRPGTDLFFLMALVQVILSEDRYDAGFVSAHTSGFDDLKALLEELAISPEVAAPLTGIQAQVIRDIARGFAMADGAYVSTRVGVQTSHNSTLTEWFVAMLAIITGNIDRPGGLYYNHGVVDVPALIDKFTKGKNLSPSRVGGFRPYFGGLPGAVLADEILTEGEGQIKALVVVAGNPVISFPNTKKMEQALHQLELLVVIDIFHNDTATFADYVLPAATAYEREGWHFLVDAFNPYPFAELRQKLVEPPGECRGEWDIFKDLAYAAKVDFLNNPLFNALAKTLDAIGVGFTPSMLTRYLLLGKTPSYGQLKKHPRGLAGQPLHFGQFFDRAIRTDDRRIHLASDAFGQALRDAVQSPPMATETFPFMLISGARRLASFNSWTHNMPKLVNKLKGNWATLNEGDAKNLGIQSGSKVRIRSEIGEIIIEARTSKEVRAGVVVVHQHWGHVYGSGMKTANQYPGVNVNNLHTDEQRDRFTGMPVYNGTPVSIEAV